MLRFICLPALAYGRNLNFNTSHVTVYQKKWRYWMQALCISIHPMLRFIMTVGSDGKPVLKHFNTSHVTVYRTERVRRNRFFLISIHPMLRFIPHFFTIDTFLSNISIHPMLRFICSVLLFIGLLITISIHPMLRFISKEALKLNVAVGFQYIPCYGLSYWHWN